MDAGEDVDVSPEEELSRKHKQERKQLQAETQKLKHSVSKGDKKKKKEVTAQVAQLEAQLTEKHEKELAEFKLKLAEVNGVTKAIAEATIAEGDEEAAPPVSGSKKTKAQRRREKKAAAAAERADEIARGEVENLQGTRHIESQAIKKILADRGLVVHEIPSDGNCMYAAIGHQLMLQDVKTSVDSLRKQTAEHMREHADDFLPFLCKHDTGDPYTPEEYLDYCHKLETTPEWGGQLELRALSKVLERVIEVIQAEGPVITTGEEYPGKALLLSYHRHMYGLGEHYNSVVPKPKEEENDEFS